MPINKQSKEEMHVDDWLDEPTQFKKENHEEIKYAKFVLEFYRMPAWKQLEYKHHIQQFQLFCTYKNKRWKVTGASRLGGIFLNSNFSATNGYDECVNVINCSAWAENP